MKKKVFIYIHTKDRDLKECEQVFKHIVDALRAENKGCRRIKYGK